MNDLIARFTSRKFLLAVIAASTAFAVAIQDNTITQPELWTIITPLLSFIGIEGAGDIASRLNQTNISYSNLIDLLDEPSETAASPVSK